MIILLGQQMQDLVSDTLQYDILLDRIISSQGKQKHYVTSTEDRTDIKSSATAVGNIT